MDEAYLYYRVFINTKTSVDDNSGMNINNRLREYFAEIEAQHGFGPVEYANDQDARPFQWCSNLITPNGSIDSDGNLVEEYDVDDNPDFFGQEDVD